MKKHTCDKCGAEVNSCSHLVNSLYYHIKGSGISREYTEQDMSEYDVFVRVDGDCPDLCYKCECEFRDTFIDGCRVLFEQAIADLKVQS